MFPLSTVLFPGAGLPLHVFEERYRVLMGHCLDGDGEFGVVLISRGSEVGGGDQRVGIGTVARIANVAELEDGRLLVVATGVRRVRVEDWLPDDPYPQAVVEDLPDLSGADGDTDAGALDAAEASLRRLRSLLSELGDVPALSPRPADHRGPRGRRLAALRHGAPRRARPPAAAGHRRTAPRMELLTGLCDAMAGDVVGLLSGADGE